MVPRSLRALTLVETVVSLFLITACLLIVLKMIFFGADIQRRAALNDKAASIASRHLGRIRTWAMDPANFYNPATWTTVAPGTPFSDTDQPEFSVSIRSQWVDIYSPCLEMEARFSGPPDRRRVLSQSYRKVEVTTSWFPAMARNRLTLVSLVGAPAVPIHHADIGASSSGPMNHDQVSNITVTARDSSNQSLPDHFWKWSQSPAAGVGSIGSFQNVTRGGSDGQYQHFYRNTTIGGVQVPVYGPAGGVRLNIEGRSVSGFDSATSQWLTNNTGNVVITNL